MRKPFLRPSRRSRRVRATVPIQRRRRIILAGSIVGVLALAMTVRGGAIYTWDPTATGGGTPSTNWNLTDTNWLVSGVDTAWDNTLKLQAVFGGTPGPQT